MQDNPSHELPSFAAYLNKVFRFRDALPTLQDARLDPEIPPQAIFMAAFYGFVFRLRSFQDLEADLAQRHFRDWIGAPRSFDDDTLRYSLSGFALEPLEQMLVDINRRLKRNKAFDLGRVQGRMVAALDGIEVLSSFSRCCESCLQRRVLFPNPEGPPTERIQYYHRAVGCQIVSSPVKPLLAIEWLQPGEGEDTAALRLLRRLPDLYGSRFFDILLLDSLYPQAPVLKLAREIDWDVVIALKQEKRDLYQNAMGLFQARGRITASPNSMPAQPPKSNCGTPRVCLSPKTILSPCASSGRENESPSSIVARIVFSQKPPITSGSGSPPWTPKHSPRPWSAVWDTTAGKTKTTAGTTSHRTGRSSTAFCMPVNIAPRTARPALSQVSFPTTA